MGIHVNYLILRLFITMILKGKMVSKQNLNLFRPRHHPKFLRDGIFYDLTLLFVKQILSKYWVSFNNILLLSHGDQKYIILCVKTTTNFGNVYLSNIIKLTQYNF